MVQAQVLLLSTLVLTASAVAVPREVSQVPEIVAREVPVVEVAAVPEEVTVEITDEIDYLDPRALDDYAPKKVSCPNSQLLRPAVGLNTQEQAYISRRKPQADAALKKWLAKTNAGFGTNGTMPTIALTTSGGGFRSFLSGAGVIQGLDERDSQGSTAGLYQALTYHAGLSGGSWLISSLGSNNGATVSSLKKSLWSDAFTSSIAGWGFWFPKIPSIGADLVAKSLAGFPNCLTDVWGRLLSYKILNSNGAAATTYSSLMSLSTYSGANAPFPIITALGVKVFDGDCNAGQTATTYEFTPYEFGTWDSEVSAFTPMNYVGSTLENGQATQCVQNYDNLGYVFGTSSSLFSLGCEYTKGVSFYTSLPALDYLQQGNNAINTRDGFAIYPNPFYKYTSTSATINPSNDPSKAKELTLVDGGLGDQNNPLFPMLQPARNIDVVLVNDNTANEGNYPTGKEIYTTYQQAFNHAGYSARMPKIPDVATFTSQGLNRHATFFGCNEPDKIMMIYLPNENFVFPSNTDTTKMSYTTSETDGMIANGNKIATQNDDAGWGVCMGCAIMKNSKQALPDACTACFEKYCYNGQ